MSIYRDGRTIVRAITAMEGGKQDIRSLRNATAVGLFLSLMREFVLLLSLQPIATLIEGATKGSPSMIWSACAYMLVLGGFDRFLQMYLARFQSIVDYRSYITLQRFGYIKQLLMDPYWHLSRSTGEKESLVSKTVNRISTMIENLAWTGTPVFFGVIATLIVLAVIAPLVAALTALSIVIYLLMIRSDENKMHDSRRNVYSLWRKLNQSGHEQAAKWRILKFFGAEIYATSRHAADADKFIHHQKVLDQEWTRRVTVQNMWLMVTSVGIYGLIGWQSIGSSSIGQTVVMIAWLTRVYTYIGSVRGVQRSIHDGRESLHDLAELFSAVPAIAMPARPQIPEVARGTIELSNVSYRYPTSKKDVLSDISLKIPAGSSIALTGKTGSGKSTLASLMMRVFDVMDGAIFIDGIDIRNWDYDHLRTTYLSVVTQEAELIDDTIYANIALGKLDATEDEVWQAVRQSAMESFVQALPDGLHTHVGEHGLRLSGGQRQRVMLARALIRQPKILVLDEATSALDARTQDFVKDVLDDLPMTTVVIAHRMATIQNCDMIYVLDDGQIVESGTHHELIELNGLYASQWNAELGLN
ncbi:ABC transporter ATP-binding protein [Candidatus Saccharibacteria bacterium]|nr:ABC transporter ATP-binding protein [Candidatus Saccharibacteria bacterium]